MKKNPNGMGSVYRPGGKRRRPWAARVTIGWSPEGKQLYQYIGSYETKEEALNALALHRIAPLSPRSSITLGELYSEWSARKFESLTKATADNYRAAWGRLKVLERSTFKDLRSHHWQHVIDQAHSEGLSRSSLQKIRTLVILLYDYALKNDYVHKNYGQYMVLPRQAKKKRDIFSDIEIQKMFDHVKEVPFTDTILIMIYSGLRVSELLSLTRFNVDLEQGIITGGSKTEAGQGRVVPIHHKIEPFIRNWYEKGGQALICKESGAPMSADHYRRQRYYPALEKLGVQRLGPHSCRHTFASLLARANVDHIYIQQVMGHTDYAFTANVYTHPRLEDLKKEVGLI